MDPTPLSSDRRRGITRRLAMGAGAVAGAGLLATWLVRVPLATTMVERRLAAADVRASFRLTRIGPFLERMEDVRIGDPAHPDLTARRIDLSLGYGLAGPEVRGLRLDGVRLRGRLTPAGLSLGEIDRLLPQTRGGSVSLPDLVLALRDVRLALETPNGPLTAALSGDGNPQRRFAGRLALASPGLRVASCALQGIDADMRLGATGGRPALAGPVRIGAVACPGAQLGRGGASVALASDRSFRRLALDATLDGFGGTAGPARFVSLAGPIAAHGQLGALDLQARLRLRGLSMPMARDAGAGLGTTFAGTPLAPIAVRLSEASRRLMTRADADVALAAAVRGPAATEVRLSHLLLAGADGGRVELRERGGLRWSATGWRADGDVTLGGGGLPQGIVMLRQAAPGAAIRGEARLAPIAARGSRLALAPLRLTLAGRTADFATAVRLDGPIGGGFVERLAAPLAGHIAADGSWTLGEGCAPVSARRLRLGTVTIADAGVTLCGHPLLRRSPWGSISIRGTTGPIRLAGRLDSGAPLALHAAALTLADRRIALHGVTATLGNSPDPTRLAVADLQGEIGVGGMIGGSFGGTGGTIGSVPLRLGEAAGSWRWQDGALHLEGRLQVSDAAVAPRFNPLAADDAVLDLKGGAITAAATLREPAGRATVATVTLAHDLGQGSGHAVLGVPGLRFATGGLQPERLTPLTLGVIANVVGTVAGGGRIDWSARGVTSSGTFGTAGLDLAAAFGPVTGIAGELRFTDLLGLVTADAQEVRIAEINPGVPIADGLLHVRLVGNNRVAVEDARWPFASGTLRLEPTTLDFGATAERHLTFRVEGLDAAAFVQQLDFPNIAATGTFDGTLPMLFGPAGGRIERGAITARPGGGTLAYVGELSRARLGTMGSLAFDALKAIRYSSLDISLDGALDGEMVSRVRFTGIREATPDRGLIARTIHNLPFRFNIAIRAPFRGLVGSARAYLDPRLLLRPAPAPPAGVQPAASEPMR